MFLTKASFKQQRIPLIPPFFHENKFLTDFKEKTELSNSHFATQLSLISNSSKLTSHIQYLTDNRLSCVSFSHDKIAQVIQKLDPKKTHGHDNTSIRMLKVYDLSIYKCLEIIFNQCLEKEWKTGKMERKNGKRVTFLFIKKRTNRY